MKRRAGFYVILAKTRRKVERFMSVLQNSHLKLDSLDLRILDLLQRDCKPSTSQIARFLDAPVTTVYAKIRRLEKIGVIAAYKALIDAKSIGRPAVAFILATSSYGAQRYHLDRSITRQIARFPEVQEVHLISGEWDFLIKIRSKDVQSVGIFLREKLRTVKGVDKTVTCLVFDTAKETTEIEGLAVKEH
jgi:Lrp/AsnC family leucine-responsive transcriptional regulator